MLIKLLPSQVPMLWDAIKYATVKANAIADSDRQTYLTKLLHDLLSSKTVCFVRLNERRELILIQLASLLVDEVTTRRTLMLTGTYSFVSAPFDEWLTDFEVMRKFAIKNGCSKLVGAVTNDRLLSYAYKLGFRKTSSNVEMEV